MSHNIINNKKGNFFGRDVIQNSRVEQNNVLLHRTVCQYTSQRHSNVLITVCILSHSIHISITHTVQQMDNIIIFIYGMY